MATATDDSGVKEETCINVYDTANFVLPHFLSGICRFMFFADIHVMQAM